MRQLNAGNGALSNNETGNTLQRRDLRVIPQPEILGGDAPVGGNRRGLGEDQPGTAHRAAAQVDQVPVIGQAIDTGVLAHGRNGNTVGQGQVAQGIGCKQQTHGAPLKSSGKAPDG
ncbi:hypothetical protein D3C77_116760 [compost metagenome]